ncbi:MAG TPA: hypothetical protein DCF81_16020 [Erythrobacter sp.]|nr:hypothetical protein [Erythrobacter sp.]|tara:strand:+ start:195 stop:425 length:231 start_codon:yes stop_codon:yes gene_type:complete
MQPADTGPRKGRRAPLIIVCAALRDGRRYDLDSPNPRLLLAVREQGELFDVMALASHDPDQWVLRRGVSWCLGYDA